MCRATKKKLGNTNLWVSNGIVSGWLHCEWWWWRSRRAVRTGVAGRAVLVGQGCPLMMVRHHVGHLLHRLLSLNLAELKWQQSQLKGQQSTVVVQKPNAILDIPRVQKPNASSSLVS